jgi:hypothetical protein
MAGKRVVGVPYGESSKRRKASRGIQVPSSCVARGPNSLLRIHRRAGALVRGLQRGKPLSPVRSPSKGRVCESVPHKYTFLFYG